MTDEQPPDDRWLTYVEASEVLGVSPEAVRSIARRQKWPRQRPNAVGLPARVLVPAERLRPPDDLRARPPVTDRTTDRDDGMREAIKSLGEAVATLGTQLIAERARADRAEGQVRELLARRSWLLWWRSARQ